MLGSMRTVSWRYVTGQGIRGLRRSAADAFSHVVLADNLDATKPLADIRGPKQLRQIGDDILRLYFAQWLIEDGLFLDLRSSRFGLLDRQLLYAPNGLWIKLRPEFRDGILSLYRSFYSTDDSAFEAALRQMGMLRPGLSPAAESELKELLHAHFGIDQRAQRFSIDNFKNSFDDLFEFFIANDYKLHSDFVWVGFYLITLYLTLEQGRQAHNVRQICSEILL